jgi:hypothetical protein
MNVIDVSDIIVGYRQRRRLVRKSGDQSGRGVLSDFATLVALTNPPLILPPRSATQINPFAVSLTLRITLGLSVRLFLSFSRCRLLRFCCLVCLVLLRRYLIEVIIKVAHLDSISPFGTCVFASDKEIIRTRVARAC